MEMHLAILMVLSLACSSADLRVLQKVMMMEMNWAMQMVMSLGHSMELLMAMSLVHSTDVRTVITMALLMETKWEQLMVNRWV